jgi:uroporphyrinogen decarboxylase
LTENTRLVEDALEAITETILAFMDACFREGSEGMFYSVQAASLAFHTEEEYARYGEPHDRRILQTVREHSRLTVLHGHGERLMFDRLAALPADVWNWDDRRAGPSLAEGKALVTGAVQGGLNQWTTLKEGTGPEARAEAQEALEQTAGTGLILGAGCVLLPQHSDAALIDLVQSLGGTVKLMGVKPQ